MLVQLLGNVSKIAFFVDFRLRPGQRYRIPAVSRPWWQPRTTKRIPRILWQTNRTTDVTLAVYANYLFNRLMTPTLEHRFFDDAACDRFIRERCSDEIRRCYFRLQIGAARADFWRVLVLLSEGGIYLDIDAAFSWPPEWFLAPDQSELFVRDGDGRLTNYCIAAMAGSVTLAAIRDAIADNIRADVLTSVFDMTGPAVVDAIASAAPVVIEDAKLVCRQGQFTKKMFQYPDGLDGYWIKEQAEMPIVRP